MSRFRHTIRWGIIPCALLMVAGCTPTQMTPEGVLSADTGNPPHGEITVWSWNIAAKALQERIPAYEKRNPSVQVTVDMTGARMSTRLMLSLAAGVGAPDVSQLQISDAPHYIATRRLADLTPVAAKYKAMFPSAQWESCTLDGKVYAIPWDTGPCAVFYKRDIFAKYGIDPATIETWDDYVRAGETIRTKSNGRTKMLPLGSNDLEPMFEILLQQTGGQIFDADGRLALDSPKARQALEVIRRIRRANIHSDVAAYSQEWMAGFADDSIASYPGAVWLAGTLKDTAKDVPGKKTQWGVFRLPAVTKGGLRVANSGGSVLVIPASCANKAAAWSFIEYVLCTGEGQLAQYKTSSLYPSFLPALQDSVMDEPDPLFGGQPVGRLFATDITKIARLNRTRDWMEATGYTRQGLSHWASEGMTDDAVLTELTRKLRERLDVSVVSDANRDGN
ncbi:MAG: sugar ABC transporter substrate-binding protein [Fibrella sp.]|nr:sugar ABC transporter substrate-binding protein [Armatimonadota bacterium]